MNTCTRKSPSKQVRFTRHDRAFAGIDMHKKNSVIAINLNGTAAFTGTVATDLNAIEGVLRPYKAVLRRVVIEAGPTGFGIARALKARGYPVTVCAPGKTARQPNPGAKCDRLDSDTLSRYAAAEDSRLLHAVAVPTEQQEQGRQVARLREQFFGKQRRTKQQIRGLLLYHGLDKPDPIGCWGRPALRRLRQAASGFPDGIAIALTAQTDELEGLLTLMARATKAMIKLAHEPRHAPLAETLRTHPGVGPIISIAFLCEVFAPGRFQNGKQVAAYCGLAPGVRQSGERAKPAPVIRVNRGGLRRLLIQGAHRWIAIDPAARRMYLRYLKNTGRMQKAIVAMARKMAVNLWNMAVTGQPYRPPVVAS